MYEQNGTVMSAVFDPDQSWTPVRAYSRRATYETLDDDYWDPHLLFVAEDVDLILALHLKTLRAMKWPTPIPEVFIHDSNQPSLTNEVDITFCSCSNPVGVHKMPVLIEINQQFGICISCFGLWGILTQQEDIPVSTLLDPTGSSQMLLMGLQKQQESPTAITHCSRVLAVRSDVSNVPSNCWLSCVATKPELPWGTTAG